MSVRGELRMAEALPMTTTFFKRLLRWIQKINDKKLVWNELILQFTETCKRKLAFDENRDSIYLQEKTSAPPTRRENIMKRLDSFRHFCSKRRKNATFRVRNLTPFFPNVNR